MKSFINFLVSTGNLFKKVSTGNNYERVFVSSKKNYGRVFGQQLFLEKEYLVNIFLRRISGQQ